MKQERYLKLAEVQAMLGISRSTLWRWQAERGLKVLKLGGVIRIRESDLWAFIKRHQQGGESVDLQSPVFTGNGND